MQTPDIVATDAPSAADRETILRLLVDFNDSRAGPAPLRQFAFFLRDPANGDTVGGLSSYAFYDWLYIDVLIVPEALRGRGLGRELMRRIENVARERDCVGIWLNTFSFQARGFYEKLGYACFGSIDDHPVGHRRLFMSKRLDAPPSAGPQSST